MPVSSNNLACTLGCLQTAQNQKVWRLNFEMIAMEKRCLKRGGFSIRFKVINFAQTVQLFSDVAEMAGGTGVTY